MSKELFTKLSELTSKDEPFAIATVIQVEGSASAKSGSKAIIDSEGKVVMGWVGGGCAESAVQHEALECMKNGETRIITVNLTEDVFGVGMPCGGMMKIYIEPCLPRPELVIVGHGRIVEMLAQFGHLVNFSVTICDPQASRESFPTADRLVTDSLGASDLKIGRDSYVVIATQHKGDHLSMKRAIEGRAAYLALIASRTRSQLVVDYLVAAGVAREDLSGARVRAPAGLDLGARTPEEIALSIIAEIVAVRRGGSTRPMMETRKIVLSDDKIDLDKAERVLNTCAPVSDRT